MNRVYKISFFVLFGLVMMGGLLLWHLSLKEHETTVVFLNVGQGDAILISQGTSQVLIDGGRSGKELLGRLGRHVPFWDRQIEYVIATHPDADHIGGLPSLLRTYRIGEVLTTGAESETETSRLFQEAIREATGQGPTRAYRGATIAFPEGGELTVEYPDEPLDGTNSGVDTNDGSLVMRFVYGETSFLLTGDLPHEEKVLPEEAPVTILKVAHHGSKHSTSQVFLDLVQPQEAVVSVGENSYGHPDPGVLERLRGRGAIIHRTDERGDVSYRCLNMEKCAYAP